MEHGIRARTVFQSRVRATMRMHPALTLNEAAAHVLRCDRLLRAHMRAERADDERLTNTCMMTGAAV